MFLSNVHHKYIKKRAKDRMANTINDSTNTFWNSPDYLKLFEATNYNFSFGNETNGYNSYMDGIGSGGGNGTGAGNNSAAYTLNVNNNQSFQYLVDVGAHINDSAKQPFDTGSSFMLLLEDFGEYFYNYNGSIGNGSANNVSFEFQPNNCSSTNSTCTEEPGKLKPKLEAYTYNIIHFMTTIYYYIVELDNRLLLLLVA